MSTGLLNYSPVCGICRVPHRGEAVELFMDVDVIEDIMDATISNLVRQLAPALDTLNVHSSRDEFQSAMTLSEGAINAITDAAGTSGHAQTDVRTFSFRQMGILIYSQELIGLLKEQNKLLHNKLKYKLRLDDLNEKLRQQEQAHTLALAQSKRKADDRCLSLKADLEKRIQENQGQVVEARRKLRAERDRIAVEEERQREKEIKLQKMERKATDNHTKATEVAEENTTLRNQLHNLRTEVGESPECCFLLTDPCRTMLYEWITRSSNRASRTRRRKGNVEQDLPSRGSLIMTIHYLNHWTLCRTATTARSSISATLLVPSRSSLTSPRTAHHLLYLLSNVDGAKTRITMSLKNCSRLKRSTAGFCGPITIT